MAVLVAWGAGSKTRRHAHHCWHLIVGLDRDLRVATGAHGPGRPAGAFLPHYSKRRPDLVRMVPPRVPNPELFVTLTGLAEIAGAAGLLVPRLAPFAAGGLALLLVAVFPANVHATRAGLAIGGRPVTPLARRAMLQILFLVAVLAAGFA